MKLKRFIALVVSLSMVLSIVPAFSVTVGAAAPEYDSQFCVDNAGYTFKPDDVSSSWANVLFGSDEANTAGWTGWTSNHNNLRLYRIDETFIAFDIVSANGYGVDAEAIYTITAPNEVQTSTSDKDFIVVEWTGSNNRSYCSNAGTWFNVRYSDSDGAFDTFRYTSKDTNGINYQWGSNGWTGGSKLFLNDAQGYTYEDANGANDSNNGTATAMALYRMVYQNDKDGDGYTASYYYQENGTWNWIGTKTWTTGSVANFSEMAFCGINANFRINYFAIYAGNYPETVFPVTATYTVNGEPVNTVTKTYNTANGETSVNFDAYYYSANGSNVLYEAKAITGATEDQTITMTALDNWSQYPVGTQFQNGEQWYEVTGTNLIPNGNFAYGLNGWYAADGNAALSSNFTTDSSAGSVYVVNNEGSSSPCSLQRSWSIESGKTYTFVYTQDSSGEGKKWQRFCLGNDFNNNNDAMLSGAGTNDEETGQSVVEGMNLVTFTNTDGYKYANFRAGYSGGVTFSNFGLYEVKAIDSYTVTLNITDGSGNVLKTLTNTALEGGTVTFAAQSFTDNGVFYTTEAVNYTVGASDATYTLAATADTTKIATTNDFSYNFNTGAVIWAGDNGANAAAMDQTISIGWNDFRQTVMTFPLTYSKGTLISAIDLHVNVAFTSPASASYTVYAFDPTLVGNGTMDPQVSGYTWDDREAAFTALGAVQVGSATVSAGENTITLDLSSAGAITGNGTLALLIISGNQVYTYSATTAYPPYLASTYETISSITYDIEYVDESGNAIGSGLATTVEYAPGTQYGYNSEVICPGLDIPTIDGYIFKSKSVSGTTITLTYRAVQTTDYFFDNVTNMNTRFVSLNMLGAHDAFTGKMSTSNVRLDAAGAKQGDEGSNAAACVSSMKTTITNKSKAQDLDALALLEAGTRYFDIRLSRSDTNVSASYSLLSGTAPHTNSVFYTTHGVLGEELEPVLYTVAQWVKAHPGEIVVLDFQEVWDSTSGRDGNGSGDAGTWTAINTLLTKTGINDLVRVGKQALADVTYGTLTNNKTEGGIVLFGRHGATNNNIGKFNVRGTGGTLNMDGRMYSYYNEDEIGSSYSASYIQKQVDYLYTYNTDFDTSGDHPIYWMYRVLQGNTSASNLLTAASNMNTNLLSGLKSNPEWLTALPVVMVDGVGKNTADIVTHLKQFNVPTVTVNYVYDGKTIYSETAGLVGTLYTTGGFYDSAYKLVNDENGEYYVSDTSFNSKPANGTVKKVISGDTVEVSLTKLGNVYSTKYANVAGGTHKVYKDKLSDSQSYTGIDNFAAYTWGTNKDRLGIAILSADADAGAYLLKATENRSSFNNSESGIYFYAVPLSTYRSLELEDGSQLVDLLTEENLVYSNKWGTAGERGQNRAEAVEYVLDAEKIKAIAAQGDVVIIGDAHYGLYGLLGDSMEIEGREFIGSGTEEDPYMIYNLADLERLRDYVNSDDEAYEAYNSACYKLVNDIDLSNAGDWEPIGSYLSGDNGYVHYFKGTFDGNNHTISGMRIASHESVWDWTGHYEGLFGYVNGATIKNFTIDDALIECCDYSGLVAAAAWGDCTFENITVTNSECYVYNASSAGIVGFTTGSSTEGEESQIIFKNITVDETNVIGALWDTYDTPAGGILGRTYKNCDVTLDNCHVSAKFDVFNDVSSAYQWWQYRRSGMLVGFLSDATNYTSKTESEDGTSTTITVDDNNISVTFTGCTVTYDEWNQYTYCEWAQRGKPSYSDDGEYRFVRFDKLAADHTHSADENYHDVPIRFYQIWTQGNYYTGFTPGREGIAGVAITDLNEDTTKNLSTGEGYETVQAAFDEAEAGDEIALLQSVEVSETLEVYDNSVATFSLTSTSSTEGITLNLLGNTITGVSDDEDFTLIENYGNLTIKDSLGTGSITTTGANSTVIKNAAGSSLNLKSADISGANGVVVEDATSGGSLTVTGKSSVTGGVYLLGATSENNSSVTMSIADGSVDSVVYDEVEAPALPTATTTVIEQDGMTFAANFLLTAPSDEQLSYYGEWLADYVMIFNKDVTLSQDSTADGYLAGQYDLAGPDWVNLPLEGSELTLAANEPLKLVNYAGEATGAEFVLTYALLNEEISDFDCGTYLTDKFLAENPDIEVTVELRMYNPENEAEYYVIGDGYTFTADDITVPALPTATVTDIENDNLTFAMNFTVDEPDEDQLEYYGSWYADFELTVNADVTFNADGTADGYLSGQYDEWSKNWINVPNKDVTLKAGESLKIMECAAELLGEAGLQVTYQDIVSDIRDFDCGVFFTQAFLDAHPDLEVTLELKMYNPAGGDGVVIGDTYKFTIEDVAAPALPTATVTDIENDELTFAMNFTAVEPSERQLDYYKNWYADFELTFSKDVTLNADGSADGYLSGQYDTWSKNWINVPNKDVTLNAGESLKIMEYAAEMLGEKGLKVTYKDIVESVKDFDCGVFLNPEFIMANPDLVVTLELRMYNNENEEESYTIGETYIFTVPTYVAKTEDKYFETLEDAIEAAEAGDTVTVLTDIELAEAVTVKADDEITLDLNGYTVSYTSAVVGEDMITNNGTLIISDSVGVGKITYNNTDTTGSNVTVSTITNAPGGVLTVSGGTIENTTPNDNAWTGKIFPFTIDNVTNGTNGAATTTINGGTIKSEYRSIRLFANSTSDENTVIITDGEMIGQVWLQAPNAKANKVTLTISGGSFAPAGRDGSSVYVTTLDNTQPTFNVTGGYFNTKIGTDNAALACNDGIAGGTFTEAAKANTNEALLATGFEFVANEDGTYGVEAFDAAAQVGTVLYKTLEEAFTAVAEEGEGTVTLLKDNSENVEIPGFTTVELVTGEYSYTGTVTLAEEGAWLVADAAVEVAVAEELPYAEGTGNGKYGYVAMATGLEVADGAQVRIGDGVDENGKVVPADSGLRFLVTVNRQDTISSVVAENADMGVDVTAEGSSSVVNIPAQKWQNDALFTIAITNIAESNYIRRFTAKAYVTVDGIKYSNVETVTRSIYQVAAGLLRTENNGEEVTDDRLYPVLNAYANQAGIRLAIADGELKANTNITTSGAYQLGTDGLHFVVTEAAYNEADNAYSVVLVPQGAAEIYTQDVDGNPYWYNYIRINNNNSLIKDKVVVEAVEGGVKLTFNADGILLRPSEKNDNTGNDSFEGSDNEEDFTTDNN